MVSPYLILALHEMLHRQQAHPYTRAPHDGLAARLFGGERRAGHDSVGGGGHGGGTRQVEVRVEDLQETFTTVQHLILGSQGALGLLRSHLQRVDGGLGTRLGVGGFGGGLGGRLLDVPVAQQLRQALKSVTLSLGLEELRRRRSTLVS